MPDNDMSYLLTRQGDPKRLRRVAFEEFVRARNSGRMIAFVGSYASEHLGYVNWSQMVQTFIRIAKKNARWQDDKSTIVDALFSGKVASLPEIDRMDLAELLALIDKHATHDAYAAAREKFMEDFELSKVHAPVDTMPNVANALSGQLGLTRFMTLNYDLELEWSLFLSPDERAELTGDQRNAHFWETAFGTKPRETHPKLLQRYRMGGGLVSSDVVTRNGCAQLIEFALGAPSIHTRILHLHGRVDHPDDLLVTRRDYRDRYWQGGFNKQPFEYGMRLIYAGNPILFVGLGAGETDVMRVLEQVLSDNPNRRAVPMFMLWNSSGKPDEDHAYRLLMNRKYGIHILFDTEIADRVGEGAAYRDELASNFGREPKLVNGFRLERPIEMLSKLAERVRGSFFWDLSDCRSPQVKFAPLPPAPRAGPAISLPAPPSALIVGEDAAGGVAEPSQAATAISTASVATGDKSEIEIDYDGPCRIDIWAQLRGDDCERGLRASGEADAVGATSDATRQAVVAALSGPAPIQAIVGDPGSGRGAIANAVAQCFAETYCGEMRSGRIVVVNGSFATETDSIFGILSGAADGETAQAARKSRAQSILELCHTIREVLETTAKINAPKQSERSGPYNESETDTHQQNPDGPTPVREPLPVTIIINGMERFLAHDGSAQSAELDVLIRLIIQEFRRATIAGNKLKTPLRFPVTLILIGTSRLMRYLSIVADGAFDKHTVTREHHLSGALPPKSKLRCHGEEFRIACNSYFDVVTEAVNISDGGDKIIYSPRSTRERGAQRRAFFAQLFDRAFATGRGVDNAALAYEILRIMAFIGQPIERQVLYHVPGLGELEGDHVLKAADRFARRSSRIDRMVDMLHAIKLVLPIRSFIKDRDCRVGLHKSTIAELRERYGVPMADSRLANGFNLSLYTAQPVDNYAPEPRWHLEISKLVDFLVGAYRDQFDIDTAIRASFAAARADTAPKTASITVVLAEHSDANLSRLASPLISDCLRAALSIMRSYYSVPALLGQSNRELDPWLRDGPLSEHAERLGRILRIAELVAEVRRLALAHGTASEVLGPPAFYPDDLVWLNNELGVVRATQGNLYEARRAYRRAMRLNEGLVEYADRQQNWRRIQLNLLQIDIDRGRIEQAEERIRNLESAIEEQHSYFPLPLTCNAFQLRGYIIETYAKPAADGRPIRVDPFVPTDFILTIAIAQGYRGLCQHLRGALELAGASLDTSVAILARLNELRAYAFFQRHRAALAGSVGDAEEARRALRLCTAAAGPSRQSDIDHSGRISLVQYGISAHGAANAPNFIPQLTETLRYAMASDMYRLQIEAMQNLAFVHLRNGDVDSALRLASDALGIATRCGFGLRKVSLRILIGRILMFSKEAGAARVLLESASTIASKLQYERAVETAENELVALGS